ncbi:MAG: hypothetical protein ACOY93_00535 [Bacillota bacterium]
MGRWVIMALLMLSLAGCTGSGDRGETGRLEAEHQRLTTENQRLAAEVQRLEEENRQLQAANQVLGKENGLLRSYQGELKAELARKVPAAVPARLISHHYLNPQGGTEGWTYRKVASADLDGDGDSERITVTSNAFVDPATRTVGWDDGHIWHVYVDEPDGTRTVIFANWVQMGRLEVSVESGSRALILEQGGGWYTTVYRAVYRGPDQVETTELLSLQRQERAVPEGGPYRE